MSASFPCSLCEAENGSLSDALEDERTLDSIQANVNSRSDGPNRGATVTNRRSMGYRNIPLMSIPMRNVIPCSFHVLHGVGAKLLELMESLADGESEAMAKIKDVYKTHMCRKSPHSQQFTG